MNIHALDHLVLTVNDIGRSCDFYRDVLGMEIRTTGQNRKAIHFGNSKINLHQQGAEFYPHALKPSPGSADLCFITKMPVALIIDRLQERQIELIEGPVQRTGATDALLSIYFCDPDGNLLEVANILPSPTTPLQHGHSHAA